MISKIMRGDIDTIRTPWRRNQKPAIWQVVKGRSVGLMRLPLFAGKNFAMSRHRHIGSKYLWLLMREGL
ncbi:MAG TPA: hypothetical protein VI336_02395 [Candidatus Saccharimonadales bacterium]|nr:hypothetical protein [Candidatus Saccharimonadales bacterium]